MLGYLLAGVIIGPSVLGLIGNPQSVSLGTGSGRAQATLVELIGNRLANALFGESGDESWRSVSEHRATGLECQC